MGLFGPQQLTTIPRNFGIEKKIHENPRKFKQIYTNLREPYAFF